MPCSVLFLWARRMLPARPWSCAPARCAPLGRRAGTAWSGTRPPTLYPTTLSRWAACRPARFRPGEGRSGACFHVPPRPLVSAGAAHRKGCGSRSPKPAPGRASREIGPARFTLAVPASPLKGSDRRLVIERSTNKGLACFSVPQRRWASLDAAGQGRGRGGRGRAGRRLPPRRLCGRCDQRPVRGDGAEVGEPLPPLPAREGRHGARRSRPRGGELRRSRVVAA